MKRLIIKPLTILIVVFLPVLLGCSFPTRLWWIIQQLTKFNQYQESLVEMTAKGNIIGPGKGLDWGGNYEITSSQITLHWNVDKRRGETLSKVWGEGNSTFYSSNGCPDGPNRITNQLTFTGTVSADGTTYSGVVNFKAADLCGLTMSEYPAGWHANRVGDYIEGEIDRKGVFSLKMQPAPED